MHDSCRNLFNMCCALSDEEKDDEGKKVNFNLMAGICCTLKMDFLCLFV